MTGVAAPAHQLTPAVLPLFRELGDLKRIRTADRDGSLAERLFRDAWAGIVRGEPHTDVMARTVAAALAAARLGGLDLRTLRTLGLRDDAEAVLQDAFDEVTGDIDGGLAGRLRSALPDGAPASGTTPPFVDALARQPRAGVTSPGRPRIMLAPFENHAEHCLLVAVYGVLVAPWYHADPTPVFVASLAHHLHNAAMPDSGFSGEILLGGTLDGVVSRARDHALAQLDPALADQIRTALAPIGGDATAEARAFHVGDVLDRVLEIQQHLRTASVTMTDVLDTYGLVHDGPVKAFHDRILADTGLA